MNNQRLREMIATHLTHPMTAMELASIINKIDHHGTSAHGVVSVMRTMPGYSVQGMIGVRILWAKDHRLTDQAKKSISCQICGVEFRKRRGMGHQTNPGRPCYLCAPHGRTKLTMLERARNLILAEGKPLSAAVIENRLDTRGMAAKMKRCAWFAPVNPEDHTLIWDVVI